MKRIDIVSHDGRIWQDMRDAWMRTGILRRDGAFSYLHPVDDLVDLEERYDYDADILSITNGPSYGNGIGMSRCMIIWDKIIRI